MKKTQINKITTINPNKQDYKFKINPNKQDYKFKINTNKQDYKLEKPNKKIFLLWKILNNIKKTIILIIKKIKGGEKMESDRKCSNCGRPLAPGASICEECGHPVHTNMAGSNNHMRKCPRCSKMVYDYLAICPNCGCNLRDYPWHQSNGGNGFNNTRDMNPGQIEQAMEGGMPNNK